MTVLYLLFKAYQPGLFDSTEAQAKTAYLKHYDDPRFLGPVTAMPMDEFKRKVMATANSPKMIKAFPDHARALFLKARVKAHTRQLASGKVVAVTAYTDKRRDRDDRTQDMFTEAATPDQPEGVAQPDKLTAEAMKHATPEAFIQNIPNNSTEIVFHQTGDRQAQKILAEGFKAGKETGLAEKRGAVYAAGNTVNEGLYSRTGEGDAFQGQKPAKVAIDIRGLNLFDATKHGLSTDIGKAIVRGDLSKLPPGYDGAIKFLVNGDVYEVTLPAALASKRIMTDAMLADIWKKANED